MGIQAEKEEASGHKTEATFTIMKSLSLNRPSPAKLGRAPGVSIWFPTDVHLGKAGSTAVSVLVITSAFAASLALLNNSARYLYALGRDGLLPAWMVKTHSEHRSPHVAVVVQGIVMVITVTVSFAAGLDPLLNVSTALIGVGSVGLMTLLGLTAMAIPTFFVRQRRFGTAFTLAPFAGGVVIIAATSSPLPITRR